MNQKTVYRIKGQAILSKILWNEQIPNKDKPSSDCEYDRLPIKTERWLNLMSNIKIKQGGQP